VTALEQRSRQFLTNLFAGPFPGHGIIMDPEHVPFGSPGDFSCSDRPLTEWRDWMLRGYEARVQWLEALDDDSVPCVRMNTGTQIFASAFGCRVQVPTDSPAFALPAVETAAEADALAEPGLDAPPLARYFELAETVRERLGDDAPVSVPDIQSPFDIAALIWRKEQLLIAMIDEPAAVKRLVRKCQNLLTEFWLELKRRFPNCNLCHCPNAWAPPELGCWLSEDEAGAMSVSMFEEFCLPSLAEMSETFGGMFMHCCATADHQYGNFARIPNLRGLNRVFQAPGPKPAVEAFSGQTVLMMAWMTEAQVNDLLDMALPTTRYLFNMPAQPLDDARRTYERLRERCPRS
jgi:hypothetical protein